MKKIGFFCLLIIVVFGVVGCSDQKVLPNICPPFFFRDTWYLEMMPDVGYIFTEDDVIVTMGTSQKSMKNTYCDDPEKIVRTTYFHDGFKVTIRPKKPNEIDDTLGYVFTKIDNNTIELSIIMKGEQYETGMIYLRQVR